METGKFSWLNFKSNKKGKKGLGKQKPSLWIGRAERIALGIIIVALVTFIIISEFTIKSNAFNVNGPSPRDVKADKEISTLFYNHPKDISDPAEVMNLFLTEFEQISGLRSQEGESFSDNEKVEFLKQKSSLPLSDKTLRAILNLTAQELGRVFEFTLLLSNEARKSGLSKDSFSDKQRLFSKGARDYSKDKNQQLVAEELLNKFLFMFIPERKIYYKDQIIIREGDLVTSDILRVLREAGAMEERRSRGFKAIGVALFVCVGMMAILVYLYQFNKLIYESVSQLTLIGIIILVILIFAKIIVLFTRADIEFNNTPLFSPFIIPIATAGMLVSVLLDSKIAISINIVVSLLAALMLQDALPFLLVTLISGTMGIYAVTRASKRADFVKAGMHISMTNLALILALYLMKPAGIHGIASKVFARDMIWGFANGILCAILGVGTLPFIEIFFRTTTSLSLMELADLNHPLMQRLLKSAPGTFHHSVNVGNLGEAAAKQIGADPLLCKAGGYYHDIGKLKRPGFFIENQLSGENVHDTLTPNLSCLIITSHVRDGIELGKEYKFTNVISNIIAEHHGTTQVSYFYNRAVEEAGPDRKEEIKDFHFRYPGPKPQSKESAIVMLADSIESVCRTLNKPTAASLKNMVKKICNDKFMDGQLDESNLTLKDLEIVEDAFVKILAGRFHTRITYPDSNDSRKGSDDFKVSESKEVKEPKEPKESKEVKKVSDLSKAPRTGNE